MAYEAPTVTEIGTVQGLTLGLDSWQQWNDEVYFWGQKVSLPGTGLS